jgi:hypothetical protein
MGNAKDQNNENNFEKTKVRGHTYTSEFDI